MTIRRFPWLLVALVAFGTPFATTLERLSFRELAARSDRVVVGTVTALDAVASERGHFIHTNVSVAVGRYVRGAGPQTLVVRTPGGQLDGRAVVAHGAPSFALGEEVLLFLSRWEDGAAKVTGYAQGKSAVITGVDGDPRLRGGVADGRSLRGVIDELDRGAAAIAPLRPSDPAEEGP